jgi:hypothetical protein
VLLLKKYFTGFAHPKDLDGTESEIKKKIGVEYEFGSKYCF